VGRFLRHSVVVRRDKLHLLTWVTISQVYHLVSLSSYQGQLSLAVPLGAGAVRTGSGLRHHEGRNGDHWLLAEPAI